MTLSSSELVSIYSIFNLCKLQTFLQIARHKSHGRAREFFFFFFHFFCTSFGTHGIKVMQGVENDYRSNLNNVRSSTKAHHNQRKTHINGKSALVLHLRFEINFNRRSLSIHKTVVHTNFSFTIHDTTKIEKSTD